MDEVVYEVGPGLNVQHVGDDDTVTCNLNARDIVGELLRVFAELRITLTVDGVRSEENEDRPFVKLVIKFHLNGRDFITALLIKRGFCYCYSFFANGNWKNVSDSRYDLIDREGRLIVRLDYDSGYTNKDPDEAGLKNLAVAVMCLSSNQPAFWRRWYIHLVFVFIESARLNSVATYFEELYSKRVVQCLSNCSPHSGRVLTSLFREEAIDLMCDECLELLADLLQSDNYFIEELPYEYRGHWGNLCNALNHEGTGWKLSPSIASTFKLPSDVEKQREVVMNEVRIIKPRNAANDSES